MIGVASAQGSSHWARLRPAVLPAALEGCSLGRGVGDALGAVCPWPVSPLDDLCPSLP